MKVIKKLYYLSYAFLATHLVERGQPVAGRVVKGAGWWVEGKQLVMKTRVTRDDDGTLASECKRQ